MQTKHYHCNCKVFTLPVKSPVYGIPQGILNRNSVYHSLLWFRIMVSVGNFVVYGVIRMLLTLVGFICNIQVMIVLTRSKLRHSFGTFFLAIAVFDILFLICTFYFGMINILTFAVCFPKISLLFNEWIFWIELWLTLTLYCLVKSSKSIEDIEIVFHKDNWAL